MCSGSLSISAWIEPALVSLHLQVLDRGPTCLMARSPPGARSPFGIHPDDSVEPLFLPSCLGTSISLCQLHTTTCFWQFPLALLPCTSHLPGHFCQWSSHLPLSPAAWIQSPTQAVVMPTSPIITKHATPILTDTWALEIMFYVWGFLFWLIVPDFILGVSPVAPCNPFHSSTRSVLLSSVGTREHQSLGRVSGPSEWVRGRAG